MKRAIIAIAAVVLVWAGSAGIAVGKVVYVDGRASGADDGTCWADAYMFLQDGLGDANESDKPVEVRVGQGIYRPDRTAAEPNGTGDRMATFLLINGVTIQGGYAGFGEADPNARDIELYETVLSGDLDGNDVDVNDPADLRDEPSRAENAYHVVTGRGSVEPALIDGFTITGGNANGTWYALPDEDSGGGMQNQGGISSLKRGGGEHPTEYAVTISNCTFVTNSASRGGGIANHGSDSKISNCSFLGNSAPFRCSGDYCDGGQGGGMHNEQSSPILTGCVFAGNSAGRGGGMYNDQSDPAVDSCTFSGNSASDSDGGGMRNDWSSPTVTGCVFSRNTAWSHGGGMASRHSSLLAADCIFIENSAGVGGGMDNSEGGNATVTDCTFAGNSSYNRGGGISNSGSDAILINCVFAGNQARSTGGAVQNSGCQPIMANCTIIQNRAGEAGGGIGRGSGRDGLVSNSILWGNSAPEGPQIAVNGTSEPVTITVAYCLVMGGEGAVHAEPTDSLDWGAGNIDCDPCFAAIGYWDPYGTLADANDDYWVMGDYHLKSQGGRYDLNEGGWTTDDGTSVCIDAGNPMSPIGAEPFPNGGIVNMGAYGGTAEASKSWFGGPPCEIIVAGDINGDCIVDFRDFRLMAVHWMEEH